MIHIRRRVSARIGLAILACLFAATTNAAASSHASEGYIPLYQSLLNEYTEATDTIVQTRVNYRGLRKDPRWKQLIGQVGKTNPKQLQTQEQRLAYWVNVYNIFAIDLIVDNYPIDGIKDIGSFFTPVWNVPAGKISGRSYTLEEVEHKILRPMGDPRIHAAIVCASVSCPPLARTAFEAATLDAQLDAILRAFLGNPKKGLLLDRAKSALHVSKIFDWFESDFEPHGGVPHFLLPHITADDAEWIRQQGGDLDLRYLHYDWNLNE